MDAKKRAILLSCCGPATFRLLQSLVLPGKLNDFSFRRTGDKNERTQRAAALSDCMSISV